MRIYNINLIIKLGTVIMKSNLLSSFVCFVTNKAESSGLAAVILHNDTTHDLSIRLEQLKYEN